MFPLPRLQRARPLDLGPEAGLQTPPGTRRVAGGGGWSLACHRPGWPPPHPPGGGGLLGPPTAGILAGSLPIGCGRWLDVAALVAPGRVQKRGPTTVTLGM